MDFYILFIHPRIPLVKIKYIIQYIMKLLEILLIVVLVVVLVHINKDDKLSVSDKLVDPVKPKNDNIINVSEEDILIENRGDPVKTTGNFPIPQSTTTSKSLSTNYPEDLSIITNGATIPNKDTITIVRSSEQGVPEESHFPKYYRKDIGSRGLKYLKERL